MFRRLFKAFIDACTPHMEDDEEATDFSLTGAMVIDPTQGAAVAAADFTQKQKPKQTRRFDYG